MNLNLHYKYGGYRRALYKALLVMKLIIIFLTTAILQVSANTYAQKITLNKSNISLEKLLSEMRSQTGYDFFYDADLIKKSVPISINVKDATIESVLSQCLDAQQLTYSVENKVVFIKKKSLLSRLVSSILSKDIQGRIFDQYGNPLGGASIKVLGTNLSTTSYETGYFNLQGVDEHATLRISYIGYVSQDIKVGSDLYNIKLVINESKLDAVEVIAYGTTTKRISTGDVSTLTAKDIQTQPVNNILDALAGRVAGLQITPTSGMTGAAPKLLIRGQSSLAATNDPLYIIDGVPTSASQNIQNAGGLDNQGLNLLFNLNPGDVESISVLKDADATAIYGSRGANGVILITTKRGKVNGMQVNLNAYTGISKVAHFMDFLDVHQYNAMRREALKNDGLTASNDPNDPGYAPDLFQLEGFDSTKTHNWQKEFLGKTAATHDINFSLSGGGDYTHFYLNSAYHSEGSVMPGNTESTRKSFLFRADHVSKDKKFNINVQANYSVSNINALPQDLASFIDYSPSYQQYNTDGSPNWNGAGGFPLAYTLQKYSIPTTIFGGSANLSYEFIPGLSAKVNTGFNTTTTDMSQQEPLSSLDPASYNYVNTLITQHVKNNNWIVEPQLQYTHDFGKHHVELLAGGTFQKSYRDNLSITGTNFANDALIGNIGSAGTIERLSSSHIPYAYNAIFSRVSYNYNQEWLANLTFRRDGSSRFGAGKQFGNFGALGLGWVFTQEKAVSDAIPFLSFGKLRGSYGITGNDQFGDFLYAATVSTGYGTGYNGQPNLLPAAPANPLLQWETNKKLEVGLELGFFKDRIFLSTSYFRNRSNNQLIYFQTSSQSGFYGYYANSLAYVQNKGFEVELTSHNIVGKFTWTTNFNLTKTDNKLLSYPNFENSFYTYSNALGQSLSLIKAYTLTGLSNTGTPVYASLKPTDRVLIGNNDPFYGGIKNDFSYKGFNFGFFIQYNRYRGSELYLPDNAAGRVNYNVSPYSLGRWQQPGDEAHTIIPAFTTGYQDYNYNNSDQLISTRNIFRLSNASLSYAIPKAVVSKLKMSKLQVYVNGQNLYVWDKYKAYELDPQTGNGALPPLRTIAFGINATF